MTTATKAARPRTTHPEHNGAQHNGAKDNGVAAIDAMLARITETDAALARITETAATLTRLTETAAAGGSQTSNVADDIVTGPIRELTMIVRSVVRQAQELFGGVVAESGKVVGLNVDDHQQSDLCLGDPTAWV